MTKRSSQRQNQRLARQLALQWLFAYECKQYEDDGHLLPTEYDDDFAAPDQAIAGAARLLFEGFCRERLPVDAAVDERV